MCLSHIDVLHLSKLTNCSLLLASLLAPEFEGKRMITWHNIRLSLSHCSLLWQAARVMRLRRPELIVNLEEYKMIHDLIKRKIDVLSAPATICWIYCCQNSCIIPNFTILCFARDRIGKLFNACFYWLLFLPLRKRKFYINRSSLKKENWDD